MPRYRVTTDQGVFEVELDRAPKSFQELKGLVEAELGRRRGPLQFADQVPGPEPPPRSTEGLSLLGIGVPGAEVGAVPQPQPGEFARIGRAVAPAALPAVGALPGALLTPANPALGIPLATGGAMLGEAANQALGLTEPSAEQIGLTGAAEFATGVAAPVATAGTRGLARRLPGASVAAHEATAQTLRTLPTRFTSAASEGLFDLVEQFNPRIPTESLREALNALQTTELRVAKGFKNPRIDRQLRGLRELITEHENEVPFQELRATVRRIGERIGGPAPTGEERGALKLLFRSIQEDLETAAEAGGQAAPALQALRAATATKRREFAVEDLAELIEKPGIITTRGDGLTQVSAGKLVDGFRRLREDAKFTKAFSDSELTQIEAIFEQATKNRALPPPSGVHAGSMRVLSRGGVVGGAAVLAGADPATASALGGIAGGAAPLIAQALMTERGRSLLMRMLATKTVLAPPELQLLAAAVSGTFATRPQGPRLEP